jgi:uncharacterized phage-associated protein
VTEIRARDVAAEIRRRLPTVGSTKLHKLLYYCQGHHLATSHEPLFADEVSARDLGPVVGDLWREERNTPTLAGNPDALSNGDLNTIGYVLSRYGSLTGTDLVRLSHAEPPWQEADRRRDGRASAPIRAEEMQDFFSVNETDDDLPWPDRGQVVELLAGAATRLSEPAEVDSIEEISSRVASLHSQLTS